MDIKIHNDYIAKTGKILPLLPMKQRFMLRISVLVCCIRPVRRTGRLSKSSSFFKRFASIILLLYFALFLQFQFYACRISLKTLCEEISIKQTLLEFRILCLSFPRFHDRLILQMAGIYRKKMSKGTLLAVCSRDSWQVLLACSISERNDGNPG